MASTERSILERIQTDLEAIDGTGSYNYDFSATDAVVLGTEPVGTAPRAPGIYVFPLNTRSSRIKGKTPLNSYSREFHIQIDGWVPRTTESTSNAMISAVDAQSDIMRALENDPTLGGVVHDLELDAATSDGEVLQLPGYGVVTLRMRVEYAEKRGT